MRRGRRDKLSLHGAYTEVLALLLVLDFFKLCKPLPFRFGTLPGLIGFFVTTATALPFVDMRCNRQRWRRRD